jgi:hypothetical protein
MDRARRTYGEIGKSYRILVVNLNGHEHLKDMPVNRKMVRGILGTLLGQWFQNFIIMALAELRKDFIGALLKYRLYMYVQRTPFFTFSFFMEVIAVYCENHTEHINTLCGQNAVYINSVRVSQKHITSP